MSELKKRAIGALVGLFVGDAFGAQSEFEMEVELKASHPNGISEMDSRERNIGEAGMVTDDSEMAIMLAKSLVAQRSVNATEIRKEYIRWLDALPSDLGTTILEALREDKLNPDSQANGALMRVAPVGVVGATLDEQTIIDYSDADCKITHIHPVCLGANRLWALAIAKAVKDGLSAQEVYEYIIEIAPRVTKEKVLLDVLGKVKHEEPGACDGWDQGWVVIAFHQSLYTLLHSKSFEEGIVHITMRGGDADTNAAIYGALAGSVLGIDAIPTRWIEALRPTRCLEDLLGFEANNLLLLAENLANSLLAIGNF